MNINPSIHNLFPPLTEAEKQALIEDIRTNGIQDPILPLWGDSPAGEAQC